jgi:hypothetical protein
MMSLLSENFNASSHARYNPARVIEAFHVEPQDVELQPVTKVDTVVEPYRGNDPIKRAWSQSKRAAKTTENFMRRGVADVLRPVFRWANEAI